MKILLVSIPSIHIKRWIDNLKDTNHELYWFDVLDEGKLKTNITITQITNWKKRKVPYIKGEFFLRKKMNTVYNAVHPFLEITPSEKFEELINAIKPDLVHSFEMQSCSYPLLKVMQQYSHIKWLYSCWGSDLFYYQNKKMHLLKIKAVLERIDALHTDCKRDFEIALSLGFKGKYAEPIPGGAGYKLENFTPYIKSVKTRNIILVKGYEHHVGRGLNCIKALEILKKQLDQKQLKVIVFGAHAVVADYVKKQSLPFLCYQNKDGLPHDKLIKIMGESLIYIGNSLSDGMPNTLLEAIIMGAFPIQSNPGDATAEIINDGVNGFLIQNPNDILSIKTLVENAIANPMLIDNAYAINQDIAVQRLSYDKNQEKIINLYDSLAN